jgi:hypothetical protein
MDLGDQAEHVKFMIRGRGPDYTAAFDTVLADAGIRTVLCSVDEFSEKSKVTALGGLAALPETIGIGIFVVGVLEAL